MHFSLSSKSFLSSFPISHSTTNTFTPQSKGRETGRDSPHLTHSSMADSSPYTKPHFPLSDHSSRIQPKPTNQGKSCSGFILKVLFLALFVAVLPLFPSQAPDFVRQTILNKFWELLHLLFIGIAVTYGLISRRNSELDTTHTELETTHSSTDDSNAAAPSYVSKVFPASSTIFYDNGCANENGNPCGVDEKMMHCWNNQYFDGGPGGVCSNGSGTVGVFDEQYKTHLPVSEDSFGYSVRCDGNGIGTGVVQAWNSEYYHSEPVVVVAQPNCNTGECGEVVDYKPLGLPIRSLRSVARDVDSSRYANESDSSSGSRNSSRGSGKSGDREFGDLGPSNLEKKFNAAAAAGRSASAIPWGSTNRWTEREKIHGNVTCPSHFRPLSADETKFEALSSGSLQSTTSFSFHTNMYSSLDSILLDNMNFQEEEVRLKEASYVSASQKMNFQEEDVGQRKTSFVPVSEIMNFQEEDMGSWKTSYAPASENTSFRERDSRKKIFLGSSSRNRKMATKGKYGAASFPSHFRPMSVDETQFDSLNSNSNAFEAVRFSSNARMYSSLDSISSDMDFQEEDMGQKKTSHMHTSENMNFQEDMGHKKTSYVHDSENMNFQEEDMEQKKTSYVPASENRNFQEVDLGKKSSQVSSSSNGMIESKGKYAGDSHLSHLRPMSVDETQLESLSSRSFQSMGSFSSRSSLCSSLDSALSENMNSPKEDLGEKKSSHGSSSSSPSPLAKRNGEASLQAFQARGYTNGSSLPDDVKSSLNGDLRGLNEIEGEDPPSKKESWIHVLQSDSEKPARVAKAPSQGKSVRTRRASGLTSGAMRIGETSSKQTDENGEKNSNNVESVMRKDKMKSGELGLPLKGVSQKTVDSYCPKPEIKFSHHGRRDKLESSKNLSKQDSDIELENTQVSSYENGVPECINDSDLDSEVDKKASEFIAKFKAQIRLQKIGSIERSKEQKITQNKIR